MSKTTDKFPFEARARAVRIVLYHEGEYSSRWAAVSPILAKIGCTVPTPHERSHVFGDAKVITALLNRLTGPPEPSTSSFTSAFSIH